nr:MAG TPA_asm: tail tape measure [Caudoviricetes sp.]
MSKQLGGPMAEAGKKAGNQLGQGIASGVEQSKAAVEKATTAVTAARAKEADAAGKVRVAEAQLQALRSKGVTDAGRLAAAEERVNAAKRNAEIRSNAAATADRNLARAKEQASTAARGGTQSMQAFGDAAEKSSSRMSLMKSAGPLAAAGIAAIGTAAVAAVKFVADIGESFEQMRSKIQLSTGASGQTLDKLNESVKNVAKGSPAAIGTIAERMSVLYQRTGLTGKELETLTKQVNKAGAALGQDLDIKTLTGTMATFGVQGKDMSSVLDDIFRVSRNTGMGMNEIVSAAKSAAPSLQEFGFNLSDSAALIGSLDKAGVDANSVLATFGKGLVNVAKAGQSPKQAFADVTKEIQGFIKQGNTAGAVNVASKIFGTRGAVQFVNAVKSGAVSMDQLTNSAAKQGDSILDAEGATVTWAKTWGLFKNNVIIALEPLATRFFDVFIKGMTWLKTNGVVAIQFLTAVFSPLFDTVSPLAERIFPAIGVAVGAVARAVSAATGFIDRHRTSFAILAGVVGTIMLPSLLRLGVAWTVSGAQAIAGAAKNAAAWVILRAEAIKSAAVSVVQSWRVVGGWIAQGASATAQGVRVAAGWAMSAAGATRSALTSVGAGARVVASWVAQGVAATVNAAKSAAAWVVASAGAGTATIRTVAYGIASKAVRVATLAWAGAQWVLNAAMSANPIGIIIAALVALVAGIVLAYKHSETFRNIVQAAWNGIKAAVGAVWGWFSGTVWPGLKAAFSAIGTAAMWLYQNAILPAWNGIQAAIGFVWGIIQGYFNMWMSVIRVLAGVVMWLWNNVVSPAFNGIIAAAQFMWSGISTIFEWFKAGVNLLGSIVNTVVSAVIEPAWNAVKAGAEFMWGGIQQIFSWIQTGWNALGTAIRWVVDNVVKPAFDAIKGALQSVWDFFGTVVSGIGTAWDKLKGFVATPINFVINTVWNNGLLNAWNSIVKFLPGLKKMSPLAPVKFAEGGSVPLSAGAKRGKDSVHALLMPEEHVWDVNDVRKSGGQGAQYRMRQMVDQGKPFTWTPSGLAAATSDGGNIPRFADGGAVSAGDKLAPMPGEGGLQDIAKLMGRIISRLWSKGVSSIGGWRPPDGYNEHYSGRALDVMINDAKTGDQVKDFSLANSKKFPIEWALWKQKEWHPDGRVVPMPDRGSPTQNHMDHDHLFYAPQSVDPNVVPDGLVTSGFGGPSTADMLNIIKKKITEIVDKALNPIKEGMSRVIGSPPPEWLGIPPKALDATKTEAINTAFDLAGKLGDKLSWAYGEAKKITSAVTNFIKSPFKGLLRDTGGFVPTGQSIVTNETGKPEAVLNWSQLNQVKSLMDKGASMSEAIAQVGAAKPQSDTIPADAVVLKDSATADEVQAAADKIKTAAEKTPDPSNGAGQPNTSGAGEASQPGKMKSLKELGQDAGGILAEGIGDFFGLPSWITDPSSAISIDKGENVRTTNQGATAGNSALTNTPETPTSPSVSQSTPQGSYTDPQYGDGSTVQQGSAPLSKMPDLGAGGAPNISYDPSKGAEQWRPLAQWAIDYVNQSMKGASQVQAMVEQIGDESGGNPDAQNNSDSNAAAGDPSVGLLQIIQSTFDSVRDPKLPNDRRNPAANLVAALRYYVPKYGKDLTARWGRGKGGYKLGGFTGNFGLDEIAGFVHGREFVVNAPNTARNFDLLSAINSGEDVQGALVGAAQGWASIADRSSRQRVSGSGGRVTNITVYGHTAGDIVNEINRNEFRGSAGYGSRVR